MFYAGDEYADDDCTSGLSTRYQSELARDDMPYCDYCEREGHEFRFCPARDYDCEDEEI